MSISLRTRSAEARSRPRRPLSVFLAAGLAAATTLVAVAGCGEREQTLQPGASSGTYQGKPDGKPWENKPTSFGSGQWPQGDRGAWERVIKARAQAQNEYVRTQ